MVRSSVLSNKKKRKSIMHNRQSTIDNQEFFFPSVEKKKRFDKNVSEIF
uniref:Uncharacterized protein n=1 Tax=viral metagenome TaxID=1070528 RepID=A0A6C0K4G9_9ZZZZ